MVFIFKVRPYRSAMLRTINQMFWIKWSNCLNELMQFSELIEFSLNELMQFSELIEFSQSINPMIAPKAIIKPYLIQLPQLPLVDPIISIQLFESINPKLMLWVFRTRKISEQIYFKHFLFIFIFKVEQLVLRTISPVFRMK